MRGRNIWGHYNKCYAIQQPQLIFPYYVFLYEYWTKEKISDKEMYLGNYINSQTGYKTFGFTIPGRIGDVEVIYTEEEVKRNRKLELLRQTNQVSSIYQGIKRIQRNLNPKGEFYVITTDEKIIELLVKQLKDIEYKYFKYNIECRRPEQIDNTTYKRILNWINSTDERTLISDEELAVICDTSLENLKKTFYRYKRKLGKRIKQKQIVIYNYSEPVDWLAKRKHGEKINKKYFEEKFNILWKSFKRSKYAQLIMKARNITVDKGIIYINM
jgi:hypothetical protein